jgi:membrane protease YdiL (CAAX protease family)
MLGVQPLFLVLVKLIVSTGFKQPLEIYNLESPVTALYFTANGFLAYLMIPFLLRVPKGKRTFRDYLNDIGLTRIRPFFGLLLLTTSCLLILVICQGGGSVFYRLIEGEPLTLDFLGQVFNLSSALPPQSMLLLYVFYTVFEEVGFRGVFLTTLLNKYSQRQAIFYSALAFGAVHFFALLAGREIVSSLAQVVWAFIFGIFYGFIFIKTGSLWPPMIIHWLSNVFQAPLTAYFERAPALERALFGIIFGYGLATVLLLIWVQFFSARWLKSEKV